MPVSRRKIPLQQNVLDAARARIRFVFDHFDHVYVSFSGGKDSGVLLNLTIEEAERRQQLPVDVLIVDFEAQYEETRTFIIRMIATGKINPYWVCLPISLRNSLSQFQPKWLCWDPKLKQDWVKPLPCHASVISHPKVLPFFSPGMEFEDFVVDFARWYQQQKQGLVAALIGLRADESLHRFNTVKNPYKEKFQEQYWTTKMQPDVFMAYPIYDWKTRDIWIANARFGWDYNRIYDLMNKAGVPLSMQRLCQPFGDEQRKGLWLYQILEPHTWQKLVSRVEGSNFGARYSKQQGHILGYYRFQLPPGFTYKQYCKFLLSTMPPNIEKHYRERIYKFLIWWKNNAKKKGITHIPDYADSKLESKKQVPSWRRICKVLIKNDYWCRGLSFGYNKTVAKQYHALYDDKIEKDTQWKR
ncbi:Co-activator of prophage gene expression IbrA [Vibrio sp. 16]|nr:Co-activator of prophage gene expression IbrA [Vibrio sp. 16]